MPKYYYVNINFLIINTDKPSFIFKFGTTNYVAINDNAYYFKDLFILPLF